MASLNRLPRASPTFSPFSRSISPFHRGSDTSPTHVLRSQFSRSQTRGGKREERRPRTCTFPLPYQLSIPGVTLSSLDRIFHAKCTDLLIEELPEQRQRFYTFCMRNLRNRKFAMNQCGLGALSAHLIAQVICDNPHFAYLELSRNALRDNGVNALITALKNCRNVVHIDLSSNDISPECSQSLLLSLCEHESLTSLDISSHEGLNRNRLGTIGGNALRRLLERNTILTCLNIAGTVLGTEGTEALAAGLRMNSTLQLLNVSNNNITGKTVEVLLQSLGHSNVRYLYLSENPLNPSACESLSRFSAGFYGRCQLIALRLSHCSIDPLSGKKLFPGLSRNSSIQLLSLEGNPLGEASLVELFQFLYENSGVCDLNLANCKLKRDSFQSVIEGLAKNHRIKRLNLAYNRIEDTGACAVASLIAKNQVLKHIDLSANYIKEKGAYALCTALKTNTTLKSLILRDNSIGDAPAEILSQLSRVNRALLALDLSQNAVHFRYTREIRRNLKRNWKRKRRSLTPTLLGEIKAMTVTPTALNSVFTDIQRKKEEKREQEEMLESQQARFTRLQCEEDEKYSQLLHDLDKLRTEKYTKLREFRDLTDEQTAEQHKANRDIQTMIGDLSDLDGDIDRLRKSREKLKESYLLKRIQSMKRLAELNEMKRQQLAYFQIAQDDLQRILTELHKEKSSISLLMTNTQRDTRCGNDSSPLRTSAPRPKTGTGSSLRKRKYKPENSEV